MTLTELLMPIRERLEKATPGKWMVSHHQGSGNLFRLDNEMSANEFMATQGANLELVSNATTDIGKLLVCLEVLSDVVEQLADKYKDDGETQGLVLAANTEVGHYLLEN